MLFIFFAGVAVFALIPFFMISISIAGSFLGGVCLFLIFLLFVGLVIYIEKKYEQ